MMCQMGCLAGMLNEARPDGTDKSVSDRFYLNAGCAIDCREPAGMTQTELAAKPACR